MSSQCYLATIEGKAVGFIAVLHFPHPIAKNIKNVHRLVVLPDYQGIGIGNRLIEFVAKIYIEQGFRFTITTSTPALMKYFEGSEHWKLNHSGRVSGGNATANKSMMKTASKNRLTTSWEYKK